LIVIDDGSPDNSFDIANEYTNRYDNIKLLKQQNQGTSGARNTGIREASGKYICFADPDDFVEPDVYGTLLQKMETDDLDMLRFRHKMIDETYKEEPMPKGSVNDALFDNEIIDGKEYLSYKLSYACYCWAFIYKSSLIKENEIYFTPGVFQDDTDWLPLVLCKAHRVTSIDVTAYNYVQWKGTLMRANEKPAVVKRVEGYFQIIGILQNRHLEESSEIVRKWYKGMISGVVLGILSDLIYQLFDQRKIFLGRLQSCNVYPLSFYRYSLRLRMKILMVNISANAYCFLIHYRNSK
jgi:heptose III glucuronosyltransferase